MFVPEKNILKINLKEINEEIEKINQIYLIRFENLFIEYLKIYNHKSIFEDISFKMIYEDNLIICPLTVEKNLINERILNYYGYPFEFFSKKKIDKKLETKLLIYLLKVFEKNNITKINMRVKQCPDILHDLQKYKTCPHLVAVSKDRFVNINKQNIEILKGFSTGLRNELKKNYAGVEYNLINKDNYKKDLILEMMNLHQKVSGTITRNKESWIVNEKMILDKKAFLISCHVNGQCISYNLFNHNNIGASWFTSCTIREQFNYVKNISSVAIWLAIKFARDICTCSYFNLGAETIYSREIISKKEKNIEFFKGKFKGTGDTYFAFDLLPTKLFYI